MPAKREKSGYGRPPAHSRFTKGRSGNPGGRPKNSKNLSTQFLEAVAETVPVSLGGRSTRMTKLQATIQQLVNKGAQGDPRAITQVLEWVADLEARADQAGLQNHPFLDADREVIAEIYRRLVSADEETNHD
jgi:hypothetical protein